ncbi:MAG: methyl-accepting chemotaxis protein [Candidatus Tectimicrobiota bacterium]
MASTTATKRRSKPKHQAATFDITLLEESFAALAPQSEHLVQRFYEELLQRYPEVQPLFAKTNWQQQQHELLASLELVLKNLRHPGVLRQALLAMGARHQGYGARPEHYKAVTSTLLDVMQQCAGALWTPDVQTAWETALQHVTHIMLEAYTTQEQLAMPGTKNTKAASTGQTSKATPAQPQNTRDNAELVRLRSTVHNAMTPIMLIDRQFIITYVNKATLAMLTQHEETFQSLYRGFSVDHLLGTCIDIFHAKPEHQRRLLDDPKNLPYSTDITVGPLIFRLNVTAITDMAGQYIGNTLEWADVTALRQKENQAARLQSAVDGAMTCMMMVDRDFVITYANHATVAMLKKHEETLRTLYRGFSADKLIGSCIDVFHKNPEHQRRMLDNPRNLPYITTIQVGPLAFNLNVSAILDASGTYVGNTLEWSDVTEQMDAQRQVEKLISDAVAGKLEERIEAARYAGFMKKLGEGINQMLDTVVTPMRETIRVISALAAGDLSMHMEGVFQGEFATLQDAVNTSIRNLLQMVDDIRQASDAVTSSAGEISQGNNDLSQRTQEQAASLEQTASSMEQMTSTIRQNADNARQANQLASSAREQAEKGGEVVGRAVSAMTQINSSSKKIADIIGVIDSIAFQTNLLALNAAVEAARAGEQGRGFAVVAAEVRKLAQRSADAAKEIKTLISDSVEKVSDGTRLVDESGKTLEEIVTAVKKVSDIIAEIASASQEQAAGIDQVNKAITQMDEVTQQNASLVEQMAAASESLDEQARGLNELMEFFKSSAEEPEPEVEVESRGARLRMLGRQAGKGSAPSNGYSAPGRQGREEHPVTTRSQAPARLSPKAPAPVRTPRPLMKAAGAETLLQEAPAGRQRLASKGFDDEGEWKEF